MDNTFKVGEVTYKIRERTREDFRNATKVHTTAFNDALGAGAPLQARVKDILKEQKLWNDDKQKEVEKLQKEINDLEFKLEEGGIKKLDARTIAIKLGELRKSFQGITTPITNFFQHTVEGQAANAQFDYLVSATAVDVNDKSVFASYEDYLNRSEEDVAIGAAKKYVELYHSDGASEDAEKLPENQFLKDHGFVDSKFRLIDSKGRLIDKEGNLVNEEGFRVNEDGVLINIYGRPIDKDGNFIVKKKPFID